MECLTNPTKNKLILQVMKEGRTTAKALAEKHKDIPQATLYRHLKKMLADGILKVVEENNYRITKNKKNGKKRVENVLLLKFVGSGMLAEENQSFVATIIDAISGALHVHSYRVIIHVEKEFPLTQSVKSLDERP